MDTLEYKQSSNFLKGGTVFCFHVHNICLNRIKEGHKILQVLRSQGEHGDFGESQERSENLLMSGKLFKLII